MTEHTVNYYITPVLVGLFLYNLHRDSNLIKISTILSKITTNYINFVAGRKEGGSHRPIDI